MSERVQGKWFYTKAGSDFIISVNDGIHKNPDYENEVARDWGVHPHETREANVEFICLAVNNHEILIHALEEAITKLEISNDFPITTKDLRAILARAKGEDAAK